jgi:hypothetical protein
MNQGKESTFVNIALDWWKVARDRWRQIHQLDQLSVGDIGRLAQDVGMSDVDFLRVAMQPNGTAELLGRRLQQLNLDPEEIRVLSPLLLRDLERTCALCDSKSQCRDDFDDQQKPVGWESYCPNSGTLKTLS